MFACSAAVDSTPRRTLLLFSPPTPALRPPTPLTRLCTSANKSALAPRAAPTSFLLSAARGDVCGLERLSAASDQSGREACSFRCLSRPRRELCSRRLANYHAGGEGAGQSYSSLAGAASHLLPVPSALFPPARPARRRAGCSRRKPAKRVPRAAPLPTSPERRKPGCAADSE